MSDMEYNEGRLVPITEEELAKIAEKVISDEKFERWRSYASSKLELFLEDAEEHGFAVVGDRYFKLENKATKYDYEVPELIKFEQHPDGSIDFATYHYNGGGHWTEIIEGKLKELEREG